MDVHLQSLESGGNTEVHGILQIRIQTSIGILSLLKSEPSVCHHLPASHQGAAWVPAGVICRTEVNGCFGHARMGYALFA